MILAVHLPNSLQGGQLPGIVEVDEAFFGRRKYGYQATVAGAIERGTRKLRLQIIPAREQDIPELFLTAIIARSSLMPIRLRP